jgi:4-amino-4-deoxy-L-arabinose transferase-like glycosyltransferase
MKDMERPAAGGPPSGSARRDLWLVAGAAALILLPWIGRPALFDRDETYYAEGAREMQEAGTWTRPLLNGRDFHQKPFLPFALIRVGYAALGVNETAARLPSALLGIGTAVLTAAIGSRLFGRAAGLRAGLVLSSSLLFLLICRSSLTDPAFLFFFTASLFFFLKCAAGRRAAIPDLVGMYASAGIATLCKGPLGVLLPAGIGVWIVARSSLSGTLSAIRRLRPLLGIGIVSAFALPWYGLAAARTHGASVRDFLLQENLGRFFSPMEGHRGPFWIYVPVLLLAFLPWSVFLPRAWGAVPDPRVRRILGAWCAVPFLLFSAAATKLPHYLLPVFPPLAILVGAEWDSEASPRASRTVALSLLIPICLALPVALLVARRRWPDLLPLSLIATAAVLPLGAGAALFARARPRLAFGVLGGSMALFAWLACGWSLPALGEVRVVRPIGILLRDRARVPTYSYRFLEPGLLFYARRTIDRLDRPEEVVRISASRPAFAIVARREDVETISRAAGRPLITIGRRRGFCEDSGPIELVVLAVGLDDTAGSPNP